MLSQRQMWKWKWNWNTEDDAELTWTETKVPLRNQGFMVELAAGFKEQARILSSLFKVRHIAVRGLCRLKPNNSCFERNYFTVKAVTAGHGSKKSNSQTPNVQKLDKFQTNTVKSVWQWVNIIHFTFTELKKLTEH